MAESKRVMAEMLYCDERYGGAAELWGEVVEGGRSHEEVEEARERYAECLVLDGKENESVKEWRAIVKSKEQEHGKEDPKTLSAKQRLALRLEWVG